jgi:hypothetical protein
VGGVAYLRADYSVVCGDEDSDNPGYRQGLVGACSLFLIALVLGLPCLALVALKQRHSVDDGDDGGRNNCGGHAQTISWLFQRATRSLCISRFLGTVLESPYRYHDGAGAGASGGAVVRRYWPVVELIRTLSLATVGVVVVAAGGADGSVSGSSSSGATASTITAATSAAPVAAALLVSVVFLGVQLCFQPYASWQVNEYKQDRGTLVCATRQMGGSVARSGVHL